MPKAAFDDASTLMIEAIFTTEDSYSVVKIDSSNFCTVGAHGPVTSQPSKQSPIWHCTVSLAALITAQSLSLHKHVPVTIVTRCARNAD